mgnify:FL=1|jgi:hypothetical protein
MRVLIIFFVLTMLTGCDRIDFSDMATAAGATGAAIGTAVITTNPMAIGAVTAGGALAGATLIEDDKSLSTEQIKEVENPWQAMLVAFDQLLAHAFEIVIAIGIAVIGIPMLITYLMGRFKQRPEDAKTINNLVEKIGKMKETG